ncbi:hypothetical protein V5799_031295 [Amblyomma americanum]|uniref:Uncharacterized protein n=1 Tax=Amblyomma americanum TaxID=6943 RepID=A0AAQ4EKU2_AMBAM
MNSTAAEAPLPTHADVDCQTAPSSSGRLTLLLCVTNGSEASTQVSHTELTDQVTLTDGSWKRSYLVTGDSVVLKVPSPAISCIFFTMHRDTTEMKSIYFCQNVYSFRS